MSIFKKLAPHKWEIAILTVIVLFGIFLRTYHFSDWMQFEIDQTYDTRLVSQGVQEGHSELPLLGPTAGGGRALRLGPAFYYLEYLSAKTFGDNPVGHAMLVLLSSILAIPLFYFFIRRYFSIFLSLLLTALFASSLYLVTYGRFSWSPNILPFFILLTFYSLLRSVSKDEARRNFWFLLFALSFAIITQIHFNAFFTIPPIVVIFIFFKRPHFPLKTWLAATTIFLLVYSPMAVSDFKTKGENFEFFIKKLSKSQGVVNGPKTALRINATVFTLENTLILTGQDEINGKKIDRENINHFPGDIWNGAFFPVLGAIILILSSYFLIFNLARKKDSLVGKRDFLWLIFLWFLFSFLYYFSLARGNVRFYPRFFLMITPLTFILFGFILEYIDSEKDKRRQVLVFFITLSFFALNVAGNAKVFASYQTGLQHSLKLETEDVFPNTNRLTLIQQTEIVAYIQSVYEENHYPVYLQTLHEYEPVFWYHLEKFGITYWAPIENNHPYRQGNYFNIYLSGKEKAPGHAFVLADRKQFGSLTVDRWTPKEGAITKDFQPKNTQEIPDQTQKISNVYTWKKAFPNLP